MKTILVPLDRSLLAAQVLPYVRTLATLLSAHVHLLHVWEIEESLFRHYHEEVERLLIREVKKLRAVGIETDFHIRMGAPAQRIVEMAEDMPDPMIAMATHGYSGLLRWTLGSVTDKVVQATQIPVFVVRSQPEPPPECFALKRILVPLDGSDFSKQALDYAIRIATAAQATLHLLHVLTPLDDAYPSAEGKRLFAEQRQAAMANMAELVEQELASNSTDIRSGAITVSWHVATGHPAEKIIDEVAYQESDLIVMATHGYSGLQRWALGSTADKVLRATRTPLVLIHVG